MVRYAFLLFLYSYLVGCKNDGKKMDYGLISSDCPTKPSIKEVKPNISTVNFYLDVSKSMEGFIPQSLNTHTDFQILIPNIINGLSNQNLNTNFYCLSLTGGILEKRNIKTIGKDLENRSLSFKSTTELPLMFDSVINTANSETVSVLITDAIYSPKDIKLRSQIVTDLGNIFQKSKGKKCSTACYAFKSLFNKDTSIFYLFVIGQSQNLSIIKNQIKNSLKNVASLVQYHEFSEISFGQSEIQPYYSILQYTETGNYEPRVCENWDNRCLVLDKVETDEDSKFWIGIDLSALPSYALEKSYLDSNLNFFGNKLSLVKLQILTKDEFKLKVQIDDKSIYDKSTHFLQIKINGFSENTGEMLFSLKKHIPAWVSLYSNSDAVNAEKNRKTTFGLDNILEGISSVYRDIESPFFFQNLKLVFTKK